ncbi:MAG: hypothetical protein ACRD2E_01205 [Terriglobales bacterium]
MAVERRELEDGYAFRFPGDAASEGQVFDFIVLERECCRFLSFEVRLAAERGAIWLVTTGPAGVKEFAQAEMARFDLDRESTAGHPGNMTPAATRTIAPAQAETTPGEPMPEPDAPRSECGGADNPEGEVK